MYGKTTVVGLSSGILPLTGFGFFGYVLAASTLIGGGLLLVRAGRRRAAQP